MSGYLTARIEFFEQCYEEIKASRGHRRIMAVYALFFVLLKLIPDLSRLQLGSLFSYRTWIIILLVILFLAFIDGGQRVLEKRTHNPKRPKLVGGIYDFRFPDLFDPIKIELARRAAEKAAAAITIPPPGGLSVPGDVIGSHVLLRLHFVNETEVETPIRNFLLKVTTNEGEFEALCPEAGEITQSSGKAPDREKQFANLIYLIETAELIGFNRHIEGHLNFKVRGFLTRNTTWFNLNVFIVDAWGDSHQIPMSLSKSTVPLPSDRLVVFPPTEYW